MAQDRPIPSPSPSQAVLRLAAELAPGEHVARLREELATWIAGSAAFRLFAERNTAKVRKKLRGARDEESAGDVRAELAVAAALLADRRLALAFEAYGSGRRGPDFTVVFREATAFNLEVTRIRQAGEPTDIAGHLLAKLRQLPPSAANALLLVLPAGAGTLDVGQAARALRARADAKDEAFFVRRGFTGTRDFYQQLLRLGGVYWWREDVAGDGRATLWRNGSARIALPDAAARAVLGCLRTGA